MWKSSFERLLCVTCTILGVSNTLFGHVNVSTTSFPNGVTLPENGLASITHSHLGWGDSAIDSATARIGFIHAETELNIITSNSAAPHSSRASGTFADTLTISAEGFEGETGYITLTLSVEVGMLLQLGDSASLQIGDYNFYGDLVLKLTTPGVTTNKLYRRGFRALEGGSIEEFVEGASFDGLNSFLVPFQFGTPFTINVLGSVKVFAAGAPPLSKLGATIDVEGSRVWLDSITDSGGNPLSNYTYTSYSGVDYSERVPEPTCGVIVLVGLFGLTAQTRFRRRA